MGDEHDVGRDRRHAVVPRAPRGPTARAAPRARDAGGAEVPAGLLHLQRAIGNRAVNQLVGTDGSPTVTGRNGGPSPSAPAGGRLRVQRVIQVAGVDYDPNAQQMLNSTFNQAAFGQVVASLNGTNFHNALKLLPPATKANFNFAFLDGALAPQPDIPALAQAIVAALGGGAVAALTPHVGDLVRALGQHAHTTAGAGDIAHFRAIAAAHGAALSRNKGAPSTVPQASLALAGGKVAAANTALNMRIAAITAKNAALDVVANYVGTTWGSSARANTGMTDIRSPHEGSAGWLHLFAAAPAEAALTAATPAHLRDNAARAGLTVEDFVDERPVGLRTYFYNNIFWPTVATPAQRVVLAWARYATEWSSVPNTPYIEFNGGGAASRIVWDYVNDRFFISAHYNWVDGYNPFFQVLGTPATY